MSGDKVAEEIGQIVCDYATVMEGAAFDLKRRLGQIFSANIKEETFTSLLGWQESRGEKLGVYSKTSRQANENSDAFGRAYNILKINEASIKKQFTEKMWTYRYWLFQDQIFRKRKSEKKDEAPAAATVEKPQGTEAVEKVRQYFPKALEELLTFEKVEDHIIIKPRQYLGSENFAKIASIIRDNGGEYISAGKESHFKVPCAGRKKVNTN